ncbi:MAG: LacI family DNA-binding transcriptional regulator [Candidatus Ratteibacteria bacterium]
MSQTITQKEIARILNVSRATVSLALRDSKKIKKETRDRIKQLAESLNYRPNVSARTLIFKKTFSVGLVLPSFTEPFYAELANQIYFFLHKKNYAGLFFLMGETNGQCEAIDFLLNRGVDGIIFVSEIGEEGILKAKKENINTVFYNKPLISDNYVSGDIYKSSCKVTEHLIRCGHKKIGFLGLKDVKESRFAGYTDTLLKHSCIYDDRWAIPFISDEQYENFFQQGYGCMKKILSLKRTSRPTAILARNDVFAIGAMRAINESGLRVPEDIAVAGFDNIKDGTFSNPPLTTIWEPRERVAKELVRVILSGIERGDNSPFESVIVQPQLVIRESCGFHCRIKKNKNTM